MRPLSWFVSAEHKQPTTLRDSTFVTVGTVGHCNPDHGIDRWNGFISGLEELLIVCLTKNPRGLHCSKLENPLNLLTAIPGHTSDRVIQICVS